MERIKTTIGQLFEEQETEKKHIPQFKDTIIPAKDNPAIFQKILKENIDVLSSIVEELKRYDTGKDWMPRVQEQISLIEELIGMWKQIDETEYPSKKIKDEIRDTLKEAAADINIFCLNPNIRFDIVEKIQKVILAMKENPDNHPPFDNEPGAV